MPGQSHEEDALMCGHFAYFGNGFFGIVVALDQFSL
jgi:hypothetical protein